MCFSFLHGIFLSNTTIKFSHVKWLQKIVCVAHCVRGMKNCDELCCREDKNKNNTHLSIAEQKNINFLIKRRDVIYEKRYILILMLYNIIIIFFFVSVIFSCVTTRKKNCVKFLRFLPIFIPFFCVVLPVNKITFFC